MHNRYFSFLTKCSDPKACSIVLRGPSKDILNEVERNLQDAMAAARNVFFDPRLVPGGGATEMAISVRLISQAHAIPGVQQWPYRAMAEALEVIPRTLIQNCGGNPVKTIAQMRAKHAAEGSTNTWGIDGETGKVVDMKEYGIWEPHTVKAQTLKTAVEVFFKFLMRCFNELECLFVVTSG